MDAARVAAAGENEAGVLTPVVEVDVAAVVVAVGAAGNTASEQRDRMVEGWRGNRAVGEWVVDPRSAQFQSMMM